MGKGKKERFTFSSESRSRQVKGCFGSHQHSLLSSQLAFYRLIAEKLGESACIKQKTLQARLASPQRLSVSLSVMGLLGHSQIRRLRNIWHEPSYRSLPCALELLFHETEAKRRKDKEKEN